MLPSVILVASLFRSSVADGLWGPVSHTPLSTEQAQCLHGLTRWDYANNKVYFGDSNEWIALQHESDTSCRRVVVETSTMLPPRQETEIPVRITRENRTSAPYEGINQALKVPNLSHVYSGRSVLPAQFTKLRVRVVNADTRKQLRKGTRLVR